MGRHGRSLDKESLLSPAWAKPVRGRLATEASRHYTSQTLRAQNASYVLLEPQHHAGVGAAGEPPNQPQDGFARTAVLKGDHVADFVANVHVHLVRHPQGELDGRLLVGLCAHHAPMLVVDGQAVLGTPLRDLRRGETRRAQLLPATRQNRGFASDLSVRQ